MFLQRKWESWERCFRKLLTATETEDLSTKDYKGMARCRNRLTSWWSPDGVSQDVTPENPKVICIINIIGPGLLVPFFFHVFPGRWNTLRFRCWCVFVQFCFVFQKEAKVPEYQALKLTSSAFGPAYGTSRYLVSSSIPIISSMQRKNKEWSEVGSNTWWGNLVLSFVIRVHGCKLNDSLGGDSPFQVLQDEHIIK